MIFDLLGQYFLATAVWMVTPLWVVTPLDLAVLLSTWIGRRSRVFVIREYVFVWAIFYYILLGFVAFAAAQTLDMTAVLGPVRWVLALVFLALDFKYATFRKI